MAQDLSNDMSWALLLVTHHLSCVAMVANGYCSRRQCCVVALLGCDITWLFFPQATAQAEAEAEPT